ncbi:putative G-protein coupled receptor 141 [Rhinophrynus dorsalis]
MEVNNETCYTNENVAYYTLSTIYSVVFIGGVMGTLIMFFLLCRTKTCSVTITVVINLLVVHSIFLLTVPFRIAYYIQRKWIFGPNWCRLVSAMIHIHMYISFVFYVILLVVRIISFFKQKDKIEFYRTLHSVLTSGTVWTIIVVVIVPLFFTQYGRSSSSDESVCFRFNVTFQWRGVIILNYFIIAIIFISVCLLLAIQIFIIIKVVKNLESSAFHNQQFWAQIKSLFFIFIMIVCFFPYHMFRIYYIKYSDNCFFYNEICLSLTALSCLDLLSFGLQTCCQKAC